MYWYLKILYGLTNLFVVFHLTLGEFILKDVRNDILEKEESGDCYFQYKHMDLSLFEKMLDSSSKLIPQGLLGGNFADLGFFDECLKISDENKEIYGKYCLSSIALDQVTDTQDSRGVNQSLMELEITQKKLQKIMGPNLVLLKLLKFGICIPDKCHSKELQKYVPIEIDDASCYTKFSNGTMSTSAIIAMSIVVIFLLIALCSTAYEIVCDKHNRKTKYPILIAFSLYSNGKKLFVSTRNKDQLTCLNGIRALSMMGVILHHTYFELLRHIDNLFYLNDWIDNPLNMFALSSNQAVDSFFLIGGLLVVYVSMKSEQNEWKENLKKVPSLYLHRYIRLTPALAVMVLIYGSGLIKYIGDGPRWAALDSSIDNCAENWWAAITYVENYMDNSKFCVSQSWYLSADFQLFVLTPFLLIPLKIYPREVLSFMYVLVGAGVAVPFYIGYSNNLSGIGVGAITPAFGSEYYFYTYNRFGPYVVGMITGYYIYKIKKKEKFIKFKTCTLFLLWIFLIGGILFCIFDGFKLTRNDNNAWVDGLYLGLNRNAWSVFVALVILLCCSGNGGPINSLLSQPVFQIISKLSYSMYLVHHLVIITTNASSRTTPHFNNYVALSQYFSYTTITLCLSVLLCLIFEFPMMTIEKLIF